MYRVMCKARKAHWIVRQIEQCIYSWQANTITIFVRYWFMCKAQKAHWIGRLIWQCHPGPFSWCDHTSSSLFPGTTENWQNSLVILCDSCRGGFEPGTSSTRFEWSNQSVIPATDSISWVESTVMHIAIIRPKSDCYLEVLLESILCSQDQNTFTTFPTVKETLS